MRRFILASLKILLGLFLVSCVLFYIVANGSEIKQELTCNGKWKRNPEQQPETAYVVLTEYRWWVHLWSDSDGNVKVQTDKLSLAHYIQNVNKTGDGSLALYMFSYEYPRKVVGGFRASNGEITIRFSDELLFIGNCHPRQL